MAPNPGGPSAIPTALVPVVLRSLPTGWSAPNMPGNDDELDVICIDSDEETGTPSSTGSSTTEADTNSDQSVTGLCTEAMDTHQVLEEATTMMSDSVTREKAISAIKSLVTSQTNGSDHVTIVGVAAEKQNIVPSLVSARTIADVGQQGTSDVAVPKVEPSLVAKARTTPSEVKLKQQEGHTPQEAAVAQALAGFVHFQRRLCKDLHVSPAKQVVVSPRGLPAPGLPTVDPWTSPVPPAASSGILPIPSGILPTPPGSGILPIPTSASSGIFPIPPCATGPRASTVPSKPAATGHRTSPERSIARSGLLPLPPGANEPRTSTMPSKAVATGHRTSPVPPATRLGTPPALTAGTKITPILTIAGPEISTATSVLSRPPSGPVTSILPSIIGSGASPIPPILHPITSRTSPSPAPSVSSLSVAQLPSMSSSSDLTSSTAGNTASRSPLQALIDSMHYQPTKVASKADSVTRSPTMSTLSTSMTTTVKMDPPQL